MPDSKLRPCPLCPVGGPLVLCEGPYATRHASPREAEARPFVEALVELLSRHYAGGHPQMLARAKRWLEGE